MSWQMSGENRMHESIVVVAAEPEQYRAISAVLEPNHYRTATLDSLCDLSKNIREGSYRAVILDLDSLPVDNRAMRELRKQNPEVPIIALSSRTFHPELQEALSLYISACLAKPLNPDELIYWVKSIFQDHPGAVGSVGEQKRMNDLG